MMHDHKPDDVSDRAPQQIDAAIAHGYIILAIDGTGGGSKGGIVRGEVFEADLVAVDSRPTFAATRCVGHRQVSNRVAFGTSQEMMPFGQEGANDLATGVIRIGDEHYRAVPNAGY